MMLVVGGQGSGKRDFVHSLGFRDDEMSASPDGGPVLLDLHELLRDAPSVDDSLFASLLKKRVVVCAEVGCGIVPMSASDRAWRDRVGRTCARLAGEAEQVVRLCCGIPQYLKGEPTGDLKGGRE